MNLNEMLATEFDLEMKSTRAVLERVPFDRADYTPHAKSMNLVRLATHIAQLCGWADLMMTTNELDFGSIPRESLVHEAKSTQELIAIFEKKIDAGRAALQSVSEAALMEPWTLRSGEHVIFTLPRYMAFRRIMMNHVIHHRAQLTVYLRLLDVPVPAVYGPSADEQ